ATGMILSNEPGYYKPGHYGIRIENLIVVSQPQPIEGGDIAMHAFETLTLAPIDRRLIEAELLSEEERAWLNAYHRRDYQEIARLIEADTDDSLSWATGELESIFQSSKIAWRRINVAKTNRESMLELI